MTKIYTKTGDTGETGLFSGERVSKADPLVDAYGTVDELNSTLGVVRSLHRRDDKLATILRQLQTELLSLGADMGSGEPVATRTTDKQVEQYEAWIDELTAEMPPLRNFILPAGHPVTAHLHQARTICRRAERLAIRARDYRAVDSVVVRTLNRLADLLFTLARYANHVYGVEDEVWK
ncbi:cob(I)yrinic acid a,c-diamide adenosyltransferase [bacterium]|nr:cob(I)yrinic acid a,c-diamide adenosyltransferase [bacterium]